MIYYVFTFHYTFGDRNIFLPTTDFWILRGSAPRITHHQPSNIKPPKITISTTPTMTKNDGSALPPHSNLQRSFHHKSTPTRLPSMIRRFLPCLALRMRPAARLFPTGQFPPERLINEPLLASDVLPRSCRHLPTPPTDRYRSYWAVARRRRWVLCLFRFESHPKLTSCFIIFPPLQLPPRISSLGAAEASPFLVPIEIDDIELQQRRDGEFYVSFAPDLIRNSPVIFMAAWCTSGRWN